MGAVVNKREDGRAWLGYSPDHNPDAATWDYDRELEPNELVDNVRVRDLPVGVTVVKHVTPLLR